MKVRHLLAGAAMALVAAMVIFNQGDIKRYIKMSMM
jgi:hypothetical protein